MVDQPIKIGWSQGELFVEAHPSLQQASQIEEEGEVTYEPAFGVEELVLAAAGDSADRIDWEAVDLAVQERRGIPVAIFRNPTWYEALF